MNWKIHLTFITPLFSHGATDTPEIRPASIRGILHHWFRLVGGDDALEQSVFGCIGRGKDSPTASSKVVVRVSDIQARPGSQNTLPHKSGGEASPRTAFLPGASCTLWIASRRPLSGEEETLFRNAVQAWLLMGTIGYRSTRAAGSFVWESDDFPFPSPQDYQSAMDRLAAKGKFKAALLSEEYADPEKPRNIVSNSLSMTEHNRPLGGLRPQRKTSPLKYRLVRFGNRFRLVAVWDCRRAVTGNTPHDLRYLIDTLRARKPLIGEQLASSPLARLG